MNRYILINKDSPLPEYAVIVIKHLSYKDGYFEEQEFDLSVTDDPYDATTFSFINDAFDMIEKVTEDFGWDVKLLGEK
ncbi:hypothetical protein VP14_078 [Vibrio phage VPMCC14]|nr:hypothetical protein VP14_078 [Vibrio phage VPMCC14]